MIPYWLLFAYFALGAAIVDRNAASPQHLRAAPTAQLLLMLGGAFVAIMVGFRFRVGGDWIHYLDALHLARYAEFWTFLYSKGDPGYNFLNIVAAFVSADIWFVNLICGMIFAWGLVRFATAQNEPWLAIVIAVPYLIIVVAMGYSRQAVALAFIMAGMGARHRGASLLRFAVYVAVAALFHKTAVMIFPLVAMAERRNKLVNLLVAVAAFILLWDTFLAADTDRFTAHYIDDRSYVSSGAMIRVALSLVAAAVFLLFSRRLGFLPTERLVWRNFSLATLALLIALLVTDASTAVDRMALYLIPLQIAVLSRLPGTILSVGFGRTAVILYAALIQFTWLNFAVHARYWVPYRFYPF